MTSPDPSYSTQTQIEPWGGWLLQSSHYFSHLAISPCSLLPPPTTHYFPRYTPCTAWGWSVSPFGSFVFLLMCPSTLCTFLARYGYGSNPGRGCLSKHVKNSMDGEGLNGWSKAQRMVNGSTVGQGLSGWSIHVLEIRKMKLCFVHIPTWCYHIRINWFQNWSKHIAKVQASLKNYKSRCACYFLAHIWPIS